MRQLFMQNRCNIYQLSPLVKFIQYAIYTYLHTQATSSFHFREQMQLLTHVPLRADISESSLIPKGGNQGRQQLFGQSEAGSIGHPILTLFSKLICSKLCCVLRLQSNISNKRHALTIQTKAKKNHHQSSALDLNLNLKGKCETIRYGGGQINFSCEITAVSN